MQRNQGEAEELPWGKDESETCSEKRTLGLAGGRWEEKGERSSARISQEGRQAIMLVKGRRSLCKSVLKAESSSSLLL